MKEEQAKLNKVKVILVIVGMFLFVVLLMNITRIGKGSKTLSIVTNGVLLYEEATEGYLIRDEMVLQGENYKNGMVQILSDGERAAKGESVFRYYSNSEENILEQIAKLDEEINEVIEQNDLNFIPSSDISSLEKQIESTIDTMYNLNYLQKIHENKNKIEAYISKKAQITGSLSPSDSYVRTLTNQREQLESELEKGTEIITAPISGLASYRVDGLEEILKVDNFDYLTSELLESFELKVGAMVPLSNERGKIVNNFKCYIATPINTENAMNTKVGETVTLRLSNSDEIDAEIVYIKEETENRILVFEIEEDIAELLEYRKITFDIIWWKYSGLKVSNSALIEIDDKTYLERSRAGNTEKILIKVLRQNDTYSIIENYEDEELEALGYSEKEISDKSKIVLYDEVVLY